jgi:hypothetical protein
MRSSDRGNSSHCGSLGAQGYALPIPRRESASILQRAHSNFTIDSRTVAQEKCTFPGVHFFLVLYTSFYFIEVTIVLFPTWSALYTAAALFGTGFGLYLGIDIALAVRVLPNAQSRGKDLGIMYTSIFLPLIVTPLLGASILNSFANNFSLLFTTAAIASLLAAGCILPIRSVK